MTEGERSAGLAVGWIEAWIRMDIEWLRKRLAPDFVHISPFGRFEDRESYPAAVEPMARKSVVELIIRDVVASGNQAVVRFENRTAQGAVETCDWARVENGVIREIRSFYDSARVREVLSPTEQKSLEGSGEDQRRSVTRTDPRPVNGMQDQDAPPGEGSPQESTS